MKLWIKPYILLLPFLIVILGIFTNGIIVGFAQSLGYFPALGLKELTLSYYKTVLSDSEFLSSLKFSLYISLVSSLLAVVLGTILAYSLYLNKSKKTIQTILYRIPILVPHIVAALIIYNILSQSGIVSRILYSLGSIGSQEQFPILLFDKVGIGIISVYLWKEIPFIAMVVYNVLSNINDKLAEVALTLGANKKQILYHILLPLIIPSILSSFVIIFAFSFGAFEVPYLLGPTSPKALAVKAYIEYSNPDLINRPYSMAINSILVFLSICLIWIYEKVFDMFTIK